MNISATISTLNPEAPTNGTAQGSTFDRRSDCQSPMSLGGTLGASTLSMRAKVARKRRINANHNSNFHAGFVPVEEDLLLRTGIRGRKRYLLYCAVVTLVVVIFLNLAVTAWLLHILGMTHYGGLASLEFLSLGGRGLIRALALADIQTVTMNDVPFGARFNSPLEILAEEAPLEVLAMSEIRNSFLLMEGQNMNFSTKHFCVNTGRGDHWISANLPSMINNNAIENLHMDKMRTSRIQGIEKYRGLYVENMKNCTKMSGSEGVNVFTNKTLSMEAPNVQLEAASLSLDIQAGIYLNQLPDPSDDIPNSNKGFRQTRDNFKLSRKEEKRDRRTQKGLVGVAYKLCVCATIGQVFMVQSKTTERISCNLLSRLQQACENRVHVM